MSHNVMRAEVCLREALESNSEALRCISEIKSQLDEVPELRKTCAALADENEGLKIELREQRHRFNEFVEELKQYRERQVLEAGKYFSWVTTTNGESELIAILEKAGVAA